MRPGGLFSATHIASSGLAAERTRMEVAAHNIANASSTRTADGTPYRRQQVVFAAATHGEAELERLWNSTAPGYSFGGEGRCALS